MVLKTENHRAETLERENAMLAPFLMGLVGGQRAMTPLAMVAIAAARDELPDDHGLPRLLGHPLVAAGALVLAVGEMAGDKQKTAPDRVVPIGIAARIATTAIAGAALSPRRHRLLGAAVAAGAATLAAHFGFRSRLRAMEDYGQTPTGFIEDVAVLASGAAIIRAHAA